MSSSGAGGGGIFKGNAAGRSFQPSRMKDHEICRCPRTALGRARPMRCWPDSRPEAPRPPLPGIVDAPAGFQGDGRFANLAKSLYLPHRF